MYENTLEVLGSGRNLVTESPSPSSEVPFLPAYSTNVRTLAFECQPACVHQIALLKPNRPPQQCGLDLRLQGRWMTRGGACECSVSDRADGSCPVPTARGHRRGAAASPLRRRPADSLGSPGRRTAPLCSCVTHVLQPPEDRPHWNF